MELSVKIAYGMHLQLPSTGLSWLWENEVTGQLVVGESPSICQKQDVAVASLI